jgi:hypothetical protein
MYNFAVLYLKRVLERYFYEKLRKSYAVNLYVPPSMMCRRRQVAFINDVIITNAFSISRVMSEDSILLDIVQREILITVFITSSLIVIICVLMKN